LPRRLPLVLPFAVGLLGFVVLVFVAGLGEGGAGVSWLDRSVLEQVHAYASPGLDQAMIDVSFLGTTGFLIPACTLLTLLLAWRRGWRPALFFALAGAGSWGLNLWIKSLVQRPRPALWLSPHPEPDWSFPSGHAMTTSAIALAVVFVTPPRWRPLVLAAALLVVTGIGFSRLYLEVHFPTDVLAGWCAGTAWSLGLAGLLLGAWGSQRDGAGV
jgi:membrane-associated phospholipid phosphatase